MRYLLFILTACSTAPLPLGALDAALTADGRPIVPDAEIDAVVVGAMTDAATTDVATDAMLTTMPDAGLSDATIDAGGSSDTGIDAAAPTATCISTVMLSRAGGTGSATWTCPGTQLASWHLKIESRDGVLVNQLNGSPCPGGSADISFAYRTAFDPLISVNRLELTDGTSVLCSMP
jgi:hypothetical protein